jgi:hypothetical protein
VKRKYFYPDGQMVELIDNRAAEGVVRLAAAGVERLFRRRIVIDVKPVSVIDVGSRPIKQPRQRSRYRR